MRTKPFQFRKPVTNFQSGVWTSYLVTKNKNESQYFRHLITHVDIVENKLYDKSMKETIIIPKYFLHVRTELSNKTEIHDLKKTKKTVSFFNHKVSYKFWVWCLNIFWSQNTNVNCCIFRYLYSVTRILEKPRYKRDFSGPKLEPVLTKQSIPNSDIRYLFSGPDNSLISRLHCFTDDNTCRHSWEQDTWQLNQWKRQSQFPRTFFMWGRSWIDSLQQNAKKNRTKRWLVTEMLAIKLSIIPF